MKKKPVGKIRDNSEEKVELRVGEVVSTCAAVLRLGGTRVEVKRVCAWGKGAVWCVCDMEKKVRLYHLQGELPEVGGELYGAVDLVVLTYDRGKLWGDGSYRGV